jgi:hypothetical protein
VRQLRDETIKEMVEAVFYMRSASRLYHSIDRVQFSSVQFSLYAVQWSEESWLVSELEDCCGLVLVSCCCSELIAAARRQFGKPGEGERPRLEAVTRKQEKTHQPAKT